jgi:hypothetical protein
MKNTFVMAHWGGWHAGKFRIVEVHVQAQANSAPPPMLRLHRSNSQQHL